MKQSPVTPYASEAPKKEQVAEMFDNIAHSYDFLNHFFSLGIDKRWRKKAIQLLADNPPHRLLDVATGTGDFALSAQRHLAGTHVTGVDISEGMLEVGRQKVAKKGLQDRITLTYGDSENLPFDANQFDAYTVAFGVRNFQNLKAGLGDMFRVLKPGGTGIVLEFSKPRKFPMKQLFSFYSKRVMPTIGKIVSKDSRAYTYLPESVAAFPDGQNFLDILGELGYENQRAISLTGGIATIYIGQKPA